MAAIGGERPAEDPEPPNGIRAWRWPERRFDPFAPGRGPPPHSLRAFVAWAFVGAWPTIGLAIVVSLLAGFAEAMAAVIVAWVVDGIAAQGVAFLEAEWVALAGAAGFFVIFVPLVIGVGAALTGQSLGPGLLPLILTRLHRHTLGHSVGFFEEDFAGRLAQKELQTAGALVDVTIETINALSYAGSAAIFALLALGWIDPRLGLILALWLVGYGTFVAIYLPRVRQAARARADARAGVSGQIVDTLGHMGTVKLFSHTGREEAAARRSIGVFRETALNFGRIMVQFRVLMALFAGVLPVVLIGFSFYLIADGQAGPGLVALAGMLSARLSQMSRWVSFAAMGVFSNLGVAEDGIRTLAGPHQLTDRDGARAAPPIGAISFAGVGFRYGKPAGAGGLEDFGLDVSAGERVALVGRSGAGKSTALALLLRLYDVEDGAIRIGGVDIRDIAQDRHRARIAMVTQETAIFNRSARDNILIGRPDADEAAVVAAARAAMAIDFISGLRDRKGRTGLDAHLGERGVRLSGGQRQRIALARAILKDAPILALDEATAALDSETEQAVQQGLAGLMAGRTVLAIAHRLSTIAAMDRIVVLEAGRVVEMGGHQQLLAGGGLYAQFWTRQSGGFLSVDAAQ